MRRLLYSFLFYMIIGLLSGFYYRELTKAHHFTGDTQLALVHTHTLILGMFMFLLLLPLEKVFKLSSYYLFNWFFVVYHLGVIVTIGMMTVKGTLQVVGAKYSPEALAGFAGIGHTGMLAGLLLLFFLLRQAIITEPRD
ncbi:DUF2871 domain-containing protein [Staphylococcus caprae]|uniref:Zn-dependent alcohol dehydrogenase n=1 Tax=Staphylococcus caprae TaxID=29380 RepID=A0ABM7FTB8_9STAP|nr:DUF2871 domain-containing protein [Staphylococcus caprae]EES41855.1 hypothetical protein HMPREF0793_0474 [Staphylococcus caprae M23864:W1]MBN6826149.1 DUF2871 domain-containing protein [Staphylococcus caprae]MBX5317619.1 DUF2871 domain-containing protein [Staphylococcus caprae]MBX5324073.1 DUF2871 domain-containing protein [Staphylococcus caprae]MDI0014379.1 DUF2871 domain-containing protein [Staphylococcus caprae]